MELPQRKPTRLKEYDYSSNGAYFITICIKDRKELLSKITVGSGVLDRPQNILTNYGEIANRHLVNMSCFYDNIIIDKYIIMPNHIHLIVKILKTESSGTSGRPSPTNSLISKFVSTFKRFCNKEYCENIFQRSFHDHIIRNENDYLKIWEYIDTNDLKWESDCFYGG